jgi:hypothetical protein
MFHIAWLAKGGLGFGWGEPFFSVWDTGRLARTQVGFAFSVVGAGFELGRWP